MVEDDLRRAFHLRLPPTVRMFRRNVGSVKTAHGGRFIAGLPGQADCYGFIEHSPWAIPFELEFKGRRGRISADQVKWREFCERRRIPYLLLAGTPSETDAQILDRWTHEFSDFLTRVTSA
jgi:hypothetical protein